MQVMPRYGFTGTPKAVSFQCSTCDPDGKFPKFFDIVEGDLDTAIDNAINFGDTHIGLDTKVETC